MRESGPDSERKAARAEGISLRKRVESFLCRYNMLQQGARVGVAVSGGSDSTALLHLLTALATDWRLELTVLHFNHGLRGAESDADEAFVAQTAQDLGLPMVSERWTSAPESNLEAAARQARLAFFQEQRRQRDLACIATGHTRDDQAETVLLRLLRGAGTTGMAGILPKTREGLIRPLLECTRAELRAWLAGEGIGWREDRTNLEPGFAARNRARLELLPLLRREWNPEIDQALAQAARLAQDEEAYWEQETGRLLPENLIFDVNWLHQLGIALQRRLMRAAIGRAKGDLRQIEFHHVEQALALARRPTGDGCVTLASGVVVERSFDQLRVAAGAPLVGPPVTWREIDPKFPETEAYNGTRYYLDSGKVTLPLQLRSWKPGDRFHPRGGSRRKRMKELFQEARVPSWERQSWPMLVSGNTVVWTRGFGVAAGFEAKSDSRRVIEVRDEEKIVRKVESNYARAASITVG